MKLRLPALLLAAVLALSIPAGAAQGTFVRSKTYAGQFSDLSRDSVFYDNVSALYEYGLSVGKADGRFGVTDSVTVGQVLIFAGRLRSLYETGDAESGAAAFRTAGQSAVGPYLLYLQSLQAVGTELDGLLTRTATRAQAAHVLANALPDSALEEPNRDLVTQAYASGRFISDVTEYTDYSRDILALYRRGICVGSDAAGSYRPDAALSRGALAAMLTRMADPALRLRPAWDLSALYSAAGRTYGSLIAGQPQYTAAPETDAAIDQDVAYMLAQERSTLTLDFGRSLTPLQCYQIMHKALDEVKSYCEQSYNTAVCSSYDLGTGKLTITFSAAACTEAQLRRYRAAALEKAIAIHDQLWAEGTITASMTETEKARAYYTWICRNCTYDDQAGDESLSHIPYALFANGTAVCDGYTGAYNLLLKLEDIDCWALRNTDHIWTVAMLDGVQVHIDTTWGDSSDAAVDYSYFAMTPAQSWSYHSW